MTFWNDPGLQPKRAYRFLLSIPGEENALDDFMIKKVTKPNFELSESEHKFLNHSFFYPGKVTWQPVSFTIVDALNPNASARLYQMLAEAGYRAPIGPIQTGDNTAQTVSKLNSVTALGKVLIKQIDAEGNNVEEWELKNPWIKSVKFGELDYDSDDLLNIEVELRYDWAVLRVGQTDDRFTGASFPPNVTNKGLSSR